MFLYIIMTATLRLHLFLFTWQYIRNFEGSYFTIWLHWLGTEKQPKHRVFGRDVPRTSGRISGADVPAPQLSPPSLGAQQNVFFFFARTSWAWRRGHPWPDAQLVPGRASKSPCQFFPPAAVVYKIFACTGLAELLRAFSSCNLAAQHRNPPPIAL